jgi:hypothetical protein
VKYELFFQHLPPVNPSTSGRATYMTCRALAGSRPPSLALW